MYSLISNMQYHALFSVSCHPKKKSPPEGENNPLQSHSHVDTKTAADTAFAFLEIMMNAGDKLIN